MCFIYAGSLEAAISMLSVQSSTANIWPTKSGKRGGQDNFFLFEDGVPSDILRYFAYTVYVSRFNLSVQKKTNCKSKSVYERMHKVKNYHYYVIYTLGKEKRETFIGQMCIERKCRALPGSNYYWCEAECGQPISPSRNNPAGMVCGQKLN